MVSISFTLAIFTLIAWGLSDFLSKVSCDKAGFRSAFFYIRISSIALALITAFFFRSVLTAITPQLLVLFIIVAFLELLGYFVFYKALQGGQVSLISPVVACSAIIVVVLSMIVLAETISLPQVGGIAVSILGIFFIAGTKAEYVKEVFQKGFPFALLATVLWGGSIFLLGYLTIQTSWVTTMFMNNILQVPIMLGYGWRFRKELRFTMLAGSAGIIDMIGGITYYIAITLGSVAIVGSIAGFFPAVTIILGFVILKEKTSTMQKIGMLAVLAGLWILAIA